MYVGTYLPNVIKLVIMLFDLNLFLTVKLIQSKKL